MHAVRLVPLAFVASLALLACGPPLAGKAAVPTPLKTSVTVLEVADSTAAYPEGEWFTLLLDTAGATYIARLEGAAPGEPRATLAEAYAQLRDEANGLGANAYQVRERCAPAGPCRFEIETYLAPEGTQQELVLAPDDVVVFGPLDGTRDATFELNGEKKTLAPLQYLVYANTGEEMTLSRGRFLTGSSLTLGGGDGDPPSYWSTTGIAVGPSFAPGPTPGIGITLNSGRVHSVDAELGRFLVAVLPQSAGDATGAGR